MVIKLAPTKRLKSQLGVFLIELLIASSLGVITLLAVGSVFISIQKISTERTKRLFVIQNINQALRSIKSNVQRAGFNGQLGQSYVISGASTVITTTPSSLTFGYRVNPDSTAASYTQIIFTQDDNQLDYCQLPDAETQTVTPCTGAFYRIDRGPFSLFDDAKLRVDAFKVQKFSSESAQNLTFIEVSLSLSFIDGSYPQTMKAQILVKNEDEI